MAGKAYTVQWRANLASGAWVKLTDIPAGAARTVDVPDPSAPGQSARLYRVLTPQQP